MLIFFILSQVKGRISFVKDQSIDRIEFPPKVYKTFESPIPVGHLRPLGWQRPPDGQVVEESMLHPEQFYQKYVKHNKPVVFRNAMDNVPAYSLWETDDYLKQKYGDLVVHVVMKKELFKTGPRKMKFRKFLKEYLYEDWYLSDIVPHEMTHELVLPKCLKCGLNKYLMESEVWFSSGGTSSTLHSHADHDLHCLLAGRKDFIFVDSMHKHVFDYKDKIWPGAGYSEIDMDMINLFKYKQVAGVPWTWSTLKPGDCIFVPSGYPHQVRSYGRSFSSTYHWAPQPEEISFADCQPAILNAVVPLNEVIFFWIYDNGEVQLSNMKLNAQSLRHHLLLLMRNSTTLTFELFDDFYSSVMSAMEEYEDGRSVWKHLDLDSDGIITRTDILATLPENQAEYVARALNKPHQRRTNYKDEL